MANRDFKKIERIMKDFSLDINSGSDKNNEYTVCASITGVDGGGDLIIYAWSEDEEIRIEITPIEIYANESGKTLVFSYPKGTLLEMEYNSHNEVTNVTFNNSSEDIDCIKSYDDPNLYYINIFRDGNGILEINEDNPK